ncbi:YciI family protein [Desulfoluna butyratoxydans]|uniref:Dimeric alpha-beta barrel n=1 Tax=Desulfoluna butyratoxydans TaxID=231438 RepID=A0A4U8YKJ6_9BACT|nr:dimeric alpha-beta barrel [Desulfoluna butyratoxydans]
MLFVVRFTDKPDSQSLRETYLQAHIAWLDERRQTILVAGSIRDEPTSSPLGAFWVVEAESKSNVHELYKSDPFWTCGMREHVDVYHWSKAFDEETLV